MTFKGFRRPDGKAGIRNKILILPCSMCASDVARIVAQRVETAVSFHNQTGCAQVPPDMEYTMNMMVGFAANPNVFGTVVIGLGCETCQASMVTEKIASLTNKPIVTLEIQKCGGTLKTTEEAVRIARQMAVDASMLQKEDIPISELIVATECGGSDPTSGLASNPAIGYMCDLFVENGATAVLSETTEFVGAEHILAARAVNEQVRERIYTIVRRYEKHFTDIGVNVREGNPTPGNKEGGLTTLEEKSLGCIHKGGSKVIQEVYDYAMPITKKGLVIMDTPGNDLASLAGMAAGGCQVAVFSTGRGTPTGNPIMPVIKVTANRETIAKMQDDIDVDVSGIIHDGESVEVKGRELFDLVVQTANGRLSKAEAFGYNEIAVMRACNFV